MVRNTNKELAHNALELNHAAYKIGCEHYNQGHFKKASKLFKESLEYWPEDPQAWFALGNCYDELNKPVKAEKYFREALQFTTSEKESDIYYNLGNSLLDQSKFSDAIECYGKVCVQSAAYRLAQKNMERAKDGNPN